jgi:exopolyphosphatase/guanosine-5'-triphosphate,3'-diphosphate pyrophosphatase
MKKNTYGIHPLSAIGSGGNINKIYKMSGKKETKHMSYDKLRSIHEMLASYTIKERIERLDLKPDRADVIVPAAKIFLYIMKHCEIEKIFVPQIGQMDWYIRCMRNIKTKSPEFEKRLHTIHLIRNYRCC